MRGTSQIALSTCKVTPSRFIYRQTDRQADRHTQLSTIQKLGIQPSAQSQIAPPFGLAIFNIQKLVS